MSPVLEQVSPAPPATEAHALIRCRATQAFALFIFPLEVFRRESHHDDESGG